MDFKTVEILVLERVCLRWSCKYFGRKKHRRKSADLHLGQGTLEHFYRARQILAFLRKIGWRAAENKFAHFFNMLLLA
jgi:hypothetical protein